MVLFSVLLQLLSLASAYAIIDRRETITRRSKTQTLSAFADDVLDGIGIHLTTSYAAAAIRYPDGTVEDLIRVKAGAEYIELMSRLADPSNRRTCETRWKRIQCTIANAQRQINKHLGRPATPDVGILSSLLSEVKSAVDDITGLDIYDVFPAFPNLVALEEEDIQDALEYANLGWLLADRRRYHLSWETNAAYVGLGYGLCKHWKDLDRCNQEERKMQWERVLFLNFDNSSFSAALQTMQSAYLPWSEASNLDTTLGWWNLPTSEIPRAKFWARIQKAIVDVGSSMMRPPNKIILLGEHAEDPEFRETVKAAIWELLEFDAELLIQAHTGVDGAMVAARGAAELAGRAEYWISREGQVPHDPIDDDEVLEL